MERPVTQGKALIIRGRLVFSPYKQGSGLSHPVGFTQVLSHSAYPAKSKYSLFMHCKLFCIIDVKCIPMALVNPGTKFQNGKL